MSDSPTESSSDPVRQPLPVLPHSGKVDQLHEQPTPIMPPSFQGGNAMHKSPPDLPADLRSIEAMVVEVLRGVYDPEIPVNIYELGLIYEINVDPEKNVKIKMTLTSPGCPVAGSLPGQVEQKIEAIPEDKSAGIELVWEPAWDKSRMSETALLDLGML